tara:strand:- start:754 stop:1365 length:612 start_codon:yes stop_codon:yes gene_type:complete
MSLHQKIFENKNLKEYIDRSLHNNWRGTYFEDYPRMDPKQKGHFGEEYVEGFMEMQLGAKVESPTNPGHDRIIDGYKTEIKFSLANSVRTKDDQKLIQPDTFTFNHIAAEKDWERFIFFGINPNYDQKNQIISEKNRTSKPPLIRAYFMEKKDFVEYINQIDRKPFRKQQGGEKSDNDDYIVGGISNYYKLIDLPFIKEIEMW